MTPLARASWTIVIAVCVIAAITSFALGYAGYGLTVLAVGAAASVNLLPRKPPPVAADPPAPATPPASVPTPPPSPTESD